MDRFLSPVVICQAQKIMNWKLLWAEEEKTLKNGAGFRTLNKLIS
jgi:hypothetical protein